MAAGAHGVMPAGWGFMPGVDVRIEAIDPAPEPPKIEGLRGMEPADRVRAVRDALAGRPGHFSRRLLQQTYGLTKRAAGEISREHKARG